MIAAGKTLLIAGQDLRAGDSTSCGCAKTNRIKALKYSHGMAATPEYEIWQGMLKRCRNPKSAAYKNYGGRGIQVCERWQKSFQNFLDDMGLRPAKHLTIERIDNDKNYEPDNCRWATRTEQCQNKRNNRLITYNNQTLCLSAWARILGQSRGMLKDRLRRGWTIKETLETPSRNQEIR